LTWTCKIFQAKRKPSSFVNELLNCQLIQSPRPLFEHFNTVAKEDDLSLEDRQNVLQLCQPIEKFLVLKNPSNDTDVESEASTTGLSNDTSRSSGKDNDHEYDSIDKFYVHPSLLERWGSAMGILVLFIGFKCI
jgi:tRNA (cytosine38-C5)-methyltransferase